MESIRSFCITIGCVDVSELSVKPDSVTFTVVILNAGQHEFGLTFSVEEKSWSKSSSLRVSSLKEISRIMFKAATEDIQVRTMFAGMEMLYRKNGQGVIEVKQRSALDADTLRSRCCVKSRVAQRLLQS